MFNHMKKNFKLAAIALATFAFIAACNNAPKEEVSEPIIDTMVVEELVDTMPVADTTIAAPTPANNAATKKTPAKKAEEEVSSVKKSTINTPKKSIDEAKGDLKKGDGNNTSTKSLKPNEKPNAVDAFKKN